MAHDPVQSQHKCMWFQSDLSTCRRGVRARAAFSHATPTPCPPTCLHPPSLPHHSGQPPGPSWTRPECLGVISRRPHHAHALERPKSDPQSLPRRTPSFPLHLTWRRSSQTRPAALQMPQAFQGHPWEGSATAALQSAAFTVAWCSHLPSCCVSAFQPS